MAWTIALMGVVHWYVFGIMNVNLSSLAHYTNFYHLSTAPVAELTEVLGLTAQPTVQALAYGTFPGVTGIFVTLVMVLMYSSAIRYIRSPMFNLFWYTHHLFILYFGLLCIHGK